MAWSSKAIPSIVELVIYINLTPVAIYTLYKHRLPSLIGHVFLLAFIILRVIADALTIEHRNDAGVDTTAAIVNLVGVSPLLLATVGFIDASRHYVFDYAHNQSAKKIGWIWELGLHILAVAGIVMLAIGYSHAETATDPSTVKNYRAVAEAGAMLLLVAWILTCVWAFLTFKESSKQKKNRTYNHLARLLLTETMVSLPFTGVRVCYTIVYTFDRSRSVNPVTASFVVDFFLVFLVQLLAALVLVLGLFITRDIRTTGEASIRDKDGSRRTIVEPSQMGQANER